MRTALPAAALCLLALAVGCGVDPEVERRPAVADPGEQLTSSPGRTALDWWEAIRGRDPEAAVARFTPAAQRDLDLEQTRRVIQGDFGRWAEASRATLLYTEPDRGGATAFMRIDPGLLVGSTLIRSGSVRLALPLVQRDGVWLIENSAWLRSTSRSWANLQRARLERRARARQREREAEAGE